MDYNEFRFEKIKELVKEGQEAATKYDTLDELIHSQDFGYAEWEFIAMGIEDPVASDTAADAPTAMPSGIL